MKDKLFEIIEARRLNKSIYFNGHKVDEIFPGYANIEDETIRVTFENSDEKIKVELNELEVR